MKWPARFCRFGALTVCALILTTVLTDAQAGVVTLEWDPNPEDIVAGYFVYVTRTTPGDFIRRFDAGSGTQFTYSDVIAGVGYYFTVAAYTSGGIVGPHSESVFHMAGSLEGSPAPIPATMAAPVAAPFEPTFPAVVCVGGDSSTVYAARTLVTTSDRITALTAFPDGRVAIVENGRHVLVVDPGASRPSTTSALTVGSPEDILGLAIDPAFLITRAVFVSIVEPVTGGGRRLRIVRYRELGDVLGQGAPIVTGISVPASGAVPFTVDVLGRLYVAVPADDAQNRRADSSYAAGVLRFESDGSTSPGNGSASPLFARGYARPTALAWSTGSASLWMSGQGAGWLGELAFVTSDTNTGARPRIPTPAPPGASVPTTLAAQAVDSFKLRLHSALVVTLAAGTDNGARFIVVRDASSAMETLIRLDPQASSPRCH